MNRRPRWILAAFAILPLTGCGFAQNTAISTMIPIFQNSVEASYRNGDVKLVEDGLPGNLLLVDGLIETRPDDERLLILASQLYFSYGVGFVEARNPERAAGLYEKAIGFGFRVFPDLDPAQTSGAAGDSAFREALAGYDIDDVPGLLWLTGSWGSWIKLNLHRPSAMAQLPRVEALAERLVELDGAYMHGLPHMLLGTMLALRPEPMGGNPTRAREQFQHGFAVSDRKFLMMHLFYARYYCRQVFDEELFDQTMEELLTADPTALPDALLLNRVSQEQGLALREMRDDLF